MCLAYDGMIHTTPPLSICWKSNSVRHNLYRITEMPPEKHFLSNNLFEVSKAYNRISKLSWADFKLKAYLYADYRIHERSFASLNTRNCLTSKKLLTGHLVVDTHKSDLLYMTSFISFESIFIVFKDHLNFEIFRFSLWTIMTKLRNAKSSIYNRLL